MKTWIHRLGSMKIAVVLLVLVLTAMAGGTIIESARGTEAAARIVYYSAWFRTLLGLFAVNVLFSLVDLWPWGRQRIGFLLTHGSMLVILAGALVTCLAKVEGRLELWEGEGRSVFIADPAPGDAGSGRSLSLPFNVRLDAFEIDYYQGTRRPAMFRSRVTVSDAATGRAFPAVIEMNRELRYAGYRLFQSGYQQATGRDKTVLLVSRDPGEAIVFSGYALLMLGMTTVLVTRVVQRRALARKTAPRPVRATARQAAACLFGAALLTGLGAGTARADTPLDPATVERLRRLPVQHDGRVMPLDTLAREAVRQVTGAGRWRGTDAVALVLGWTFEPQRFAAEPLVVLGSADLNAAIGLPRGTRHASFRDLAGNPRLLGLIEQTHAAEQGEGPLQGPAQEAQKLEERLLWLQGFLDGTSLTVIPDPSDPQAPWSAPPASRRPDDLLAIQNSGAGAAHLAPGALDREIAYNRLRPSRLAWWILTLALLASVLAWNRRRPLVDAVAIGGLLLGFAVMTWGLLTRWQVAGRIPASNMYESLLFLGWGVGLFAVVALVFLKSRLVVLNATAMSALTMALVDLLPIDPFIHPMPPVLSGTPWLAIHVPIIMVSYSVLALGVFVAHMQIGVTIFAPARRELAFRMNDLLYWYIHIGSILLIAGIITGSIWAASSWGRYWGWDPKEVWSLVAFLAYLAILHGRFDRMIGTFGVAALSIVAFWTILMTYIGVNFVLTAGLHSYGFGGSGVVRSMLIVGAFEALFLAVGLLAHVSSQRRFEPAPA
ncbi:MAG TPA: cytochrome c biogenesis protein CcsA [Candidatus Polarisedimenticolia bacterium]|nr:cytochrome c biogenesis protein CcsA [Candidatus Polarisedimenticolia bacterium]